LSKIDIFIAIILAIGGILGYKRGFLMELFFLVAIVLGVLVGFKLMGVGVSYLHKEFSGGKTFLPYLSFLIIFILVVIVVVLIGRSIKNSLDKTFLGKMDSIAGAVLGVTKYAFCISVMIWLSTSLRYVPPENWTKGSWLYPATADFAHHVAGFFGGFIPFFKEIFRQF
jgi:membrane protein required for colicin V production